MSQTLIIHPYDPTTDFLKDIYQDWHPSRKTVINDDISRSKLERLIRQHQEIIMLGHGDDKGLFGFDRRIITKSFHWHLKSKKLVGIWCNADKFFQQNKLIGIYTGMIISEMTEAYDHLDHTNFTQLQIDESNNLFAKTIQYIIKENSLRVLPAYDSETNPIIQFNKHNIFKS